MENAVRFVISRIRKNIKVRFTVRFSPLRNMIIG